MKISYNWLKKFIEPNVPHNEVASILTDIGLEVEDIIHYHSVKGGLEGLVIGEVVECTKHPNADKLSVTKTNIGNGVILPIVCGAPNVAVGQKVVVAPVGSMVHPTDGEPFAINKAKIRGEVSEGMICAEDEIGMGRSHAGIMVLPSDAPLGMAAKDYFEVDSDIVFEIGLTPNRSDAASHYGVARDLAAYFRKRIILEEISEPSSSQKSNIPIQVHNAQACLRYAGVSIQNIKVEESPKWLQNYLKAIGVRPINNIVDITNFILHDLGQPLHAFDADKIKNSIQVKTCTSGTLFTTLDGKEHKLTEDDLMICDDEKALCIAGVFGGLHSGVNEETTNLFIESAYFHPVWVRKTSKRLGLKTDSSFRFERGTDPNMPIYALKKAIKLITELAGGSASGITDVYPNPISPFIVEVSYNNIRKLIGKDIDFKEIKSILEHLGIHIKNENSEILNLEVPPYKVDVTRECDVIEEILRIYGLNNIEIPQQVKSSINISVKPDTEKVQNIVADMLTANGFFEILTNSLTKSNYATQPEGLVKILNPLSSDLDCMRQSLLHSGLEVISYNQKHKNSNLKLYEFGKTYFSTNEHFNEEKHLSIFVAGAKLGEQWSVKTTASTFYNLKATVDAILKRLQISPKAEDLNNPHFSDGVKYTFKGAPVAELGIVNAQLSKEFDLKQSVFYADIYWSKILDILKNHTVKYSEVSKYPVMRRDLSLLVDTPTRFGNLADAAYQSDKSLLKDVNIFDVYTGDKLPSGKKYYTLSFIFGDESGTLTDERIDETIKRITLKYEKDFGAEIRK